MKLPMCALVEIYALFLWRGLVHRLKKIGQSNTESKGNLMCLPITIRLATFSLRHEHGPPIHGT